MQKVWNLTIICSLFTFVLAANAHADEWVPSKSLGRVSDVEQIMVKTVLMSEEIMELVYSVPVPEIMSAANGAEKILLGNAPIRGEPGKPVLPVIPIRLILPSGRDLGDIEVVTGARVALPDKYLIEHGQKPYPLLPDAVVEYTDQDEAVYESDDPYPYELYEVVDIQRKRGVSVLFVNLNPVLYRPKSGELSYYETVTIRIQTRSASPEQTTIRYRPDPVVSILKSVDNPELIESYNNRVKSNSHMRFGSCNPTDSYQYVLVTSESIRDASTTPSVNDLISQKQSLGLSATVVTIEDILSEYSGVDDAEKLRNFIIDAYNNWETNFVLLGGDTNIIPLRYLYADGTNIPSDLYYQCLDGSYNSDGDSRWGESHDGPGGTDVDLMAEVYIGRASVEDADEMSNFIFKTISYENEEDGADYLRTALMVGEHLGFGGDSEYAKPSKEEIRLGSSEHGYTTAGFASSPVFTVNTLYDMDYTWSSSEIVSTINSNNFSIFNHLGHANTTYVMKFHSSTADALTNDNFLFVYSQGCNPGDFGSDCIAEHLTTSTRHGCFSVVMNSRYGWGTYNSTDGPSQRFDRQFFDAYFGEYMLNFGALNADSHEDNLWDINGDCIRWCYYETNLFGDPHTPMRGLHQGPYIIYHSSTIDDSVGGDNDGIVNPGEEIIINVTLKNIGGEIASNVSATLSEDDGYITISDGEAEFGDIQAFGSVEEALDGFAILISPDCPTPKQATLELTITDGDQNEWTDSFTISIYSSSHISGHVRTITGGNPIEGAVVEYTGPLSGSVTTNPGGSYMFGGIDGTYYVLARAEGYLESDVQVVTVPPDVENVDFELGRPEISVDPTSISESVSIGDSVDVPLMIYNYGDADLEFTISATGIYTPGNSVPAEDIYDESHFVELSKDEEDTRIGLPITLGSGGPDNFGYTWIDSDEPNGPVYVWDDISSTGTTLSNVSGCDDCYQQVDLSFTFPFYENEYSSIYVGSNGYITLGSGSSKYSNYPLPSSSAPANLIAGFYDDLYPRRGGDIYFQDFGNKAIVQFDHVGRYSGSGAYTYQMVLHNNGRIMYYYHEMSGSLTSATVGIQNQTKDDGLNIVYNNSYIHNGLAVKIQAGPEWLRISPETGVAAPGSSVEVTVTLDSEGLYGGEYSATLEVNHNDPITEDPLNVPVTFVVDGERHLSVSPETYDFGSVWIGNQPSIPVTLSNNGNEATVVNDISSDNSVFTHDAVLPLTVPPFADVTFTLTFTPEAITSYSGTLTIESNAEDNPLLTVALSGEGTQGPEISVDPTSISETVSAGDSVDVPLMIYNYGAADLEFTILATGIYTPGNSVPAEDIYDESHFVELSKDEEDTRIGLPVTLGSGGPDNFGYTWIDSDEPNGPVYVWDDISSTGTTLYNVSGCDNCYQHVDLSFTFPFYENEYSSICVGSNGYITLGSGSSTYANYPLPSSSAPANLIAGFYDDLRTSYQGTIYFQDFGNKAIVQFDHVGRYSGSGAYTYQMVLHNNGRIMYYYHEMSGSLTSATVGIQNQTKDDGLNIVYNNSYIHNGLAVKIQAGPEWLRISPETGVAAPGSSVEVTVTLDSEGLYGGEYSATLEVNHNDPITEDPLNVPVTFVVDGERHLSVSPETYDFGSVWIGNQPSIPVTLSNNGNEATVVNDISSDNSVFTHDAVLPLTVPPFADVTFTLTFTPEAITSYSGTLTIESNAEDNPLLTVALSGEGTQGPEISVDPTSISETVSAGDSVDVPLMIYNYGAADLEFTILATGIYTPGNSVPAEDIYDESHFVELSKDEEDTRIGLPVTLGSGGPDNFGYTWIDSDEPNGPVYVWDDISSTGTTLSNVSGCDDCYQQVDLSFTFPFYENEYSSIYVGSNGYITLGSGSSKYSNYPLPSSSAPANLIAGFYDDLYPRRGGDIYFQDFGNKAIVQFDHVGRYSGSGAYTYQMVLHNNGRIMYYYHEMSGSLTSATVGIQNQTKDDGLNIVYNNSYIHNGLAVKIQAGPEWLRISPETGVAAPGSSVEVTVTLDSEGLYGGEYSATLEVNHNDPITEDPLNVPVTFVVDGERHLSVSPETYDFGSVWIGNQPSIPVTLSNNGNEATVVNDISSDNSVFTHDAVLPLTVPPFADVTFTLTFTPEAITSYSGTLTIESNAEDNPLLTVALSGEGTQGPEISVDPTSISETVSAGDSVDVPLMIYNYGAADLEFTILATGIYTPGNSVPAEDIYDESHFVELSKDEEDTRIGLPVTLGSGGPDNFGYTWIDSDEPNGPVYVWDDISSTGTTLSNVSGCDDCYQEVDLSFTFPFYENEYSSIYVGSNGYITLGSGSSKYSNYPLPSSSAPANLIAGFYDDLYPRRGGDIYFQDFGDKAVVQFDDVSHIGGSGLYTYQIVLYNNGRIMYYYHEMSGNLTSTTVGIQNQTKDDGFTIVYNNSYIHNGLAVKIQAGPEWLRISPETGVAAPGSSVEVTVTLDSEGLYGGEYSATLEVNHNDPITEDPLNVPVTMTVFGDSDGDGIPDSEDNCLKTPNGPDLGTCVKLIGGVFEGTGVACENSGDCEYDELCEISQLDVNDNGIGDTCECYADINFDTKVNLSDLVIMKSEFGKTDCDTNPCLADCYSDDKVNLFDLVIMKFEFGNTDCPSPPTTTTTIPPPPPTTSTSTASSTSITTTTI